MTRPRVTERLLLARAAGIVAVILAYTVFRAPYLTSPIEAVATWITGVVLAFWFENTITRWHHLRHARQLVENAPTGPVWPTDIDTLIAESRAQVLADGGTPIVDRGVFVEPALFTHTDEFEPMHHTPARGFSLPEVVRPNVDQARKLLAAFEEKHDYVGRHRLADDQLNRERTGQFFGDL